MSSLPICRILGLAVLTGVAATAAAVEGPEPDTIGRMDFDDGALVVHPRAGVGATYDTNVVARHEAEDDFSVFGLAGVGLNYRLDEAQHVTFVGQVRGDRYVDHREFDLVGGNATLGYQRTSQEHELTGQALYDRALTFLAQTGERVVTEDGRVTADGTWHALYSDYGLGASAERLRYLDDTSAFTARSGTYDRYTVTARYAWRYAQDASATFRLTGDATAYDDNTQFNDERGLTAAGGWKKNLDRFTTIATEVGLGYSRYRISGDRAGTAFDRSESYAPALLVDYETSDEAGDSFGVRLTSGIANSVSSNSSWNYGLDLQGRRVLTHVVQGFASLGAAQFRDTSAAAGQDKEVRTSLRAGAGLDWAVQRGLTARLDTTYLDSQAKVAQDYQRILVTVSLTAVY
ncbi:MAG: hypothetical protein H0X38_09145 [Planctomycetes bacterium]|nr:hypothetical protein [Planctomycetota bacterium]